MVDNGLSMVPWIRKYLPGRMDGIIGQKSAIAQIESFIKGFRSAKKKALFLYGPSGSGKTSAAHAAAFEHSLEIVEVNASDARNKDGILQRVGTATQQMSLFSKGKIILVDEVDGLSGTKDRGGIPAIVDIIKKSSFPIILTGNNPFDKKFSALRNVSTLVEFNPLSHNDIAEVLERICKKEGIEFEPLGLTSIGRRAAGDMRAAINDLQSVYSAEGRITKDAVGTLGERNQTDSIVEAITRILKSTDIAIAIDSLNNIDEDLNEVMLWLDANMPLEYEKPCDLARAYDMLSRADIFNSRIRRWQHWRFLSYVNNFLSAGVAVAKDERYKKFVEYKPTGRILKMWWAKQKSMKKKSIAEKLAGATHTSSKQVGKDIDYFRTIYRNDPKAASAISEELDLDKDEIEWLRK